MFKQPIFKALGAVSCLLLVGPSGAAQPKPSHQHGATAQDELVEAPAACALCGMNRTRFAKSRMLAVYPDGTRVGTCSIHCMAIELKRTLANPPKTLLVGAYRDSAHRLIDARAASWVIGGSERGVMTAQPKWAFPDEGEVTEFLREKGGKEASYAEAMTAASQESDH